MLPVGIKEEKAIRRSWRLRINSLHLCLPKSRCAVRVSRLCLWVILTWIDVERAFAGCKAVTPSLTCRFQLDEGKGTRRDFALACPTVLAATTACSVLPALWFPPRFTVCTDLSLTAWDATVEVAGVHSHNWPACWVQCAERSRQSMSEAVQNIWDDYLQEPSFVPMVVWERVRAACDPRGRFGARKLKRVPSV